MFSTGLIGALIGITIGGIYGMRGGWCIGYELVRLGNAPEY